MIDCYRRLGLKDLQANVEQVYQTNYHEPSAQGAKGHKWWHLW